MKIKIITSILFTLFWLGQPLRNSWLKSKKKIFQWSLIPPKKKCKVVRCAVTKDPSVNCAWHYVSLVDSLTVIWWVMWSSLQKECGKWTSSSWSWNWSSYSNSCNQSRATAGNVVNVVPKTPVVKIKEQSSQTRECWSDPPIPRKIASTVPHRCICATVHLKMFWCTF